MTYDYDPKTPIGQLINAIQVYAQHYWREKIAKEIEAVMCDTPNHGDSYQDMKHEVADWAFKEAIRIARGEPNED